MRFFFSFLVGCWPRVETSVLVKKKKRVSELGYPRMNRNKEEEERAVVSEK
jgi:hypothetical protein